MHFDRAIRLNLYIDTRTKATVNASGVIVILRVLRIFCYATKYVAIKADLEKENSR